MPLLSCDHLVAQMVSTLLRGHHGSTCLLIRPVPDLRLYLLLKHKLDRVINVVLVLSVFKVSVKMGLISIIHLDIDKRVTNLSHLLHLSLHGVECCI